MYMYMYTCNKSEYDHNENPSLNMIAGLFHGVAVLAILDPTEILCQKNLVFRNQDV